MACITAPSLPRPPGLDLLLPTLELSPPQPSGANLCCNFEPPPIPGGPLILPLGLIPGASVLLQPVMTVIMTAVDTLNAMLDELQFSCPMD